MDTAVLGIDLGKNSCGVRKASRANRCGIHRFNRPRRTARSNNLAEKGGK